MKQKIQSLIKKLFEEKSEEKNKWFIIIITIIYSIIMVIACCYHEAWEDESQAWLIARDLSLDKIYEQMRYEGHSCFWHYLLVPFAKSGLPFEAIKLFGIIPAIITVILILKKAPFNRFTKLLIIFSSTFLYYMPVIIRPYSLLPLFVVLLAIIYKDRKEKPIQYGLLLAAISNLHITLIGFTGMLAFMFFIEEIILNRKNLTKKQITRNILGLIIATIGILFIIIQAVQGSIHSIVNVPSEIHWSNIFNNLKKGWNEVIRFMLGTEYLKYVEIMTVIILATIIIQSILNSRKQGVIFLVSIVWFWFVHSVIWAVVLNQRAAILFVFLVFYAWCSKYDNNYCKHRVVQQLIVILICFICIISTKNTFMIVKDEIEKPYKDSKSLAKFIEKNIEEGSTIITMNYECTTPMVAYLSGKDYKFYGIYLGEYMTYVTWKHRDIDEINIEKILSEKLGTEKKYLLYSLNPEHYNALPRIIDTQNYIYERIYQGEKSICGNYNLYEVIDKY